MDLLPLLEQCGESDGVLRSDLIRLLVNLTQPTYLCFGSEYPLLQGKEKKDPETVRSFMEVDHCLRDYKDAFTRPAVMNVLGATLAHHCQKDWESRDDDDTVMIERVLLLIRNILHIPPDQTEERVSHHYTSKEAERMEGTHRLYWCEVCMYIHSTYV